jgi:integrase
MNQRERQEAAELTLPEYYERHHRNNYHAGRSSETIKEYRTSLAHWCKITNNPRLKDIDSSLLGEFKSRLLSADFTSKKVGKPSPQMTLFSTESSEELQPKIKRYYSSPLAKETVNKHLRHIQGILRKAGEQGYKNMDALGVLEHVPWTRQLSVKKHKPKNIPDDILDAIYRATEVAKLPNLEAVNIPAPNWWKALILAALSINFRREGLLALRWENIDWQERIVALDAEDDKKDADRRKPISDLMLKHFLRIRSPYDTVFPWSHGKRVLADNCSTMFYKTWHKIQFEAGLKDKKRHIKLHDLKKAAGSRLSRITSPYTVMKQLDHADLETTLYYVEVTDEQREAVEKVPLPKIFMDEFKDDAQAKLG